MWNDDQSSSKELIKTYFYVLVLLINNKFQLWNEPTCKICFGDCSMSHKLFHPHRKDHTSGELGTPSFPSPLGFVNFLKRRKKQKKKAFCPRVLQWLCHWSPGDGGHIIGIYILQRLFGDGDGERSITLNPPHIQGCERQGGVAMPGLNIYCTWRPGETPHHPPRNLCPSLSPWAGRRGDVPHLQHRESS